MKRFLMSTVAAGLTLSMIGAPLAMAQSNQHHDGPQISAHSDEVHSTGPQHPVQHTTIEHTNVQHTMVNRTMPHQMTQMSHEEQRPAPRPVQHYAMQHQPMQHAAYSGHTWHHGDHYTGGRNYVTNWNSYHLSAPPAGYQWVQDGSQFVLIAVASGIIADVILNAVAQ